MTLHRPYTVRSFPARRHATVYSCKTNDVNDKKRRPAQCRCMHGAWTTKRGKTRPLPTLAPHTGVRGGTVE